MTFRVQTSKSTTTTIIEATWVASPNFNRPDLGQPIESIPIRRRTRSSDSLYFLLFTPTRECQRRTLIPSWFTNYSSEFQSWIWEGKYSLLGFKKVGSSWSHSPLPVSSSLNLSTLYTAILSSNVRLWQTLGFGSRWVFILLPTLSFWLINWHKTTHRCSIQSNIRMLTILSYRYSSDSLFFTYNVHVVGHLDLRQKMTWVISIQYNTMGLTWVNLLNCGNRSSSTLC